MAAKISSVLEIFQKSQMLNFQELCNLVVKQSFFLNDIRLQLNEF